jgi:ribonuclease HI
LYWIPGNGKRIKVWDDSILGEEPLGHHLGIQNIKQWLQEQHVSTLWDLSSWDNGNNWSDWNLRGYPPRLDEEEKLLSKLLQGKTPLNQVARDKRGWGTKSGSFTSVEGYQTLMAVPHAAPNPILWKYVWSTLSIPKVDLFCWNIAHRSILTAENLRKRGLEGPSRCTLCKNYEENMDHLLLSRPFSREVWQEVLPTSMLSSVMPALTADLLSNWADSLPFHLAKKGLLKTVWMLLPKYVFWNLWLERNNRLFRSVERPPSKVAMKAKVLLGETLEHKPALLNAQPLDDRETTWLTVLAINAQAPPSGRLPVLAAWEIRMSEEDFLKWRLAQETHCLFFDGASKGNPGPSGGGGVILSPSGSTRSTFAWGLGEQSNNFAEYYALWQGLRQALNLSIQTLSVFGDSKLVVQAMCTKKRPSSLQMNRIYQKIRILTGKFQTIRFFHVLRHLNKEADHEANLPSLLSRSTISVNGIDSTCNIL